MALQFDHHSVDIMRPFTFVNLQT